MGEGFNETNRRLSASGCNTAFVNSICAMDDSAIVLLPAPCGISSVVCSLCRMAMTSRRTEM